jgi:alternate signal-mediated exported protein
MPQPKNKSRGVYIKVGIASAGAIALLAGGAGTFAAWNSSTSISGGTVSTGKLKFDTYSSTNEAYYDLSALKSSIISNQSDATPIDPITGSAWDTAIGTGGQLNGKNVTLSSYSFAPGDLLEMKTTVTLNAQGNNLAARVDATPQTATAGQTSNKFILKTVLGNVDHSTITATSGGGSMTWDATNGYYTITTVNNTASVFTVPVYVTIELNPENGTSDNANQSQNNVSLAGIDLKVSQLLPGNVPTSAAVS